MTPGLIRPQSNTTIVIGFQEGYTRVPEYWPCLVTHERLTLFLLFSRPRDSLGSGQ